MKIATIGCGFIAKGFHGYAHKRYKEENKDVILSACCDRDLKAAKEFAGKFGYHAVYTDYKQMLDEVAPDAVCLFVPPPVTAQISIEILNMGIPVLIEKPPGITKKEAEAIRDAANRNTTPYMIALNRRFMPMITYTLEYIRSQKIDISVIDYQMIRNNRTDEDFSTTAIHGIDLVKFIAGSDYMNITPDVTKVTIDNKNATNIFLNTEMDNGIFSSLSFINSAGVVAERLSLHGDGNSIFIKLPIWGAFDAPGKLTHIRNGTIVAEFTGSPEDKTYISNGFYDETREFFEGLRNNQPLVSNIDSCLQSMEVAESFSKVIKSKL